MHGIDALKRTSGSFLNNNNNNFMCLFLMFLPVELRLFCIGE